jgi:anti-anti-sigma factor
VSVLKYRTPEANINAPNPVRQARRQGEVSRLAPTGHLKPERQGRGMLSEQHLLETRRTESYKYFALERAGEVLVVVLGQSLDTLCDPDLFEERTTLLEELCDPAIRAVVFDFGCVEYFDSLVLDTLCQAWQRLRERESKMALCNLSEVGQEIVRLSRLGSLWHLHPSRPSALEALGLTENATALP